MKSVDNTKPEHLDEPEEGIKMDDRTMRTYEILFGYATEEELEILKSKNKSDVDELIKRKVQDVAQATHKPIDTSQTSQPMFDMPKEEKTEYRTNTKPEKQSFSFRADVDKINHWKAYAIAVGAKDIGALWTTVLDEYISNHPLTAEQQMDYDAGKRLIEKAKL